MERSFVPHQLHNNDAPEPSQPEYLSAVATESSNTIRNRHDKEMLRPIYLNGVEVGFAYAQNDVDKRLSVRGLTIALFHFLSAGHQVLALLPHCFKIYREKCTDHDELMALHRMNLIEFTPGYGSDKYVEVNRLVAGAAYESGGCIVARSQMHAVVGERPCLEEIVEKRLLMPSFMGDDIIFPIDGPLGRIGLSLAETLICSPTDAFFAACGRSQLLLSDQSAWLQKLSNLLPEKLSWSSLASHFTTWQPEDKKTMVEEGKDDSGLIITLAGPIRPPESNPAHGRGFSLERRKRGNTYVRDHYNCPERLRETRDPVVVEEEDDDDTDFLPSYAIGDKEKPAAPESLPSPATTDPVADGQELHIGRPGSLYRIVSADEMASRERDNSMCSSGSTAVAAAKTTEITNSAFRRGGAGDFDQRQMPAPRRFGFGTSPPRRSNNSHHNGSTPPPMTYDRSPPRTGTIMAPRSSSTFNGASLSSLRPSSSPPRLQQLQQLQPLARCSISAADPDDRPPHPLFSQLALVLGFDLAKRVTQRHPHELDMNRLANLALDISNVAAVSTAASAAAPTQAAPAASRSGSATSQASSNLSSDNRQLSQNRRRDAGQQRTFNRGVNRSPTSGASRASIPRLSGFNRSRVAAQQHQADESTAASVISPSVSDSAHSVDIHTDSTAVSVVNDNLIDWDSDANAPEEEEAPPPSVAAPVAPVSHLLD